MKTLILFLLASLNLTAFGADVGPQERIASVSHVRGTAEIAVAEASDFTAVADVAGSLGGKYFKFYDAGDAHCYAPWYDVDNGSSAPTVSGCTLVEVDIAADDTDATVAGNTRTVLNAAPYTNYFAITGATTHVIVTSLLKGAATDGNVGTSGFSVSKTQGVSSSALISSANVAGNVVAWKVCNDAVQTSTYLFLGSSSLDAGVDGVSLGKGKCFVCESCGGELLKSLKVSSQAASDGYAVIQYKK